MNGENNNWKETMKKEVLNLKGGEFKKWYKSLGTVGRVMYEKVREEISEEHYKQRNKK